MVEFARRYRRIIEPVKMEGELGFLGKYARTQADRVMVVGPNQREA